MGLMFLGLQVRGADLEIELMPELDLFGNQIEVVQGYQWDGEMALAFGIYDTGASVLTLSATDRAFFEMQGATVPVKVPGGAQADAVDGVVVGDVSMPMTFWADGLHAVSINWSSVSWEMEFAYDLSGGAIVPGVQVFLGTDEGSPQLPNIAGTPIHLGTIPGTTDSPAAKIDMLGYEFDLGEFFADDPFLGPLFQGMVIYMPDLSFVPSGERVTGMPGETTDPVRIPLSLFGPTNHPEPGEEVTVAPNPVQDGVSLQEGLLTVANALFLFDTGASISVITSALAEELGLNLGSPETTIDIVGAAGSPVTVPGFTIDSLSVPIDSDFDGVNDGVLRFLNAPVFVLDLVEGLDGILGMNLWNTARDLLYDPFDPLGPSLQVTFLTAAREIPSQEDRELLQLLASLDPMFGQMLGISGGPRSFPRFDMRETGGETGGGEEVIPEPASVTILILGGGLMASAIRWSRRKRR
ncbi:MAG: retropepsin-like aspartic protease [Thermogutta sp.]